MDARKAAGLAATAAIALGGCGEKGAAKPPAMAGPPGAPAMVVQDDAELMFAGRARATRAFDLLERSGVRAVRLTASWSALAPAPRSRRKPRFDATDPAAYRAAAWAPIDRAVKAARERGMAINVDIGFWAPVWATDGDTSGRPKRNIDPREFALFARAVARRYKDDVGTFTLWNEPNSSGFLGPQRAGGRLVSPHLYRRMVQAAYPAVKGEARNAKVLVGALAAYGGRGGIPALRFVREMACVDRKLRPLKTVECRGYAPVRGDGFSHHPYSTGTRPDQVEPGSSPDVVPIARLGELTRTLDALADSGRIDPSLRDVYLTEYGYESDPPDRGAPFSPAEAARMTAFAEAIAAREPRVRTVAQFLVRDLPPSPGGQAVGDLRDWQSGLLFTDGRPKPLAAVLPAPLHVERVDSQFVRLWGRVRPGNGRRPVRVESRRGGGPWRLEVGGKTDIGGTLERELPAPPGTSFRIGRTQGGRWVYGPPVAPLG